MTDSFDMEAVKREIILLSAKPVSSLTARKVRDREIQRAIMQATGGLSEGYWTTSDMAKEWTAETDALSPEDAAKQYEAFQAVEQVAVEPDNDIEWMAEWSSFPTKRDAAPAAELES